MTKAERERIEAFRSIGCICCAIQGWYNPNYDCHHIVDKGYRRLSGGHLATIPLCLWAHRGVPLEGWTKARMLHVFGPSLALQKREFILRFGTERQLLDKVNERLEYLQASSLKTQPIEST